MNTNDHNTRQDAIEEAFCHYLKRVDAGEPIDKDDFLAQYPEIADSLAEHLAADSVVRKLAGPTFAETQTDLQGTLIVSSKEPSALNETVISSPSMDTHCDKQSTNWGIPEQFGRYLVKKLLGQGAMGAVYLAHDTQLDRDVALKVPKFEKQKDSEVLERFYREARAVATLHHPNICPVYDVGEIEGQPFLSMAYIEGRPLSDFAKSMKKQAERSAAKLVMKLALALQEAHEIGVVHRDLKPANIMVGKKGEPVVMDFGLARRLDSNDTRVTQSGTIVGTPAYMSPEQVEGNSNAIGPKSDQYSLGVIFYELLTGRLPFQGSVLSVIGQIAHMEPPSINKLRSDVDSRLAAIGKKMMAKPPQDRYENMAAVASAINAYLVESKIEASPENQSLWDQTKAATPKQKVSEPTRRTPARSLPGKTAPPGKKKGRKPSKRKPLWMILIAATITLLLAAGIFYFQTAEGTVRIEIKEPEVQVAFQDKTFTIDDNGTPIEVKPGKHKLLVKRGGLEVPTEEFTVSRNGDVAIQVTWLNGELKVLNDGNTIGSHRVPSESTPSSIGSSSRNSNQITLLRKLQGLPEGLEDLAFAPDGKSVVAASVTEVRRWNLEDGQTITSGKLPSKSRIMTMRLLRDNQRLLTGSFRGGKGIQLWNLHNLEMLSEFKGPPTETSHTWVCDVSPDNRLALTGGSDGIHRVWDLETGRELKQFDDKGSYGANAAFSPDGRRIAKGSWQALTILNVETLEIERTIPSLEMGKIAPVVFSPDNQFVLASGQGSSRGDLPMGLVLLEVKSGRRLHYISLPEPSYSCVFLPDGKHFLAGCTDKTIRVWNTHSGEEVFRVTTENYSTNYVAIAPDGRTLASGGGYFWDEEAKERGYASFDGDGHVYLWQLPESVWPKLTNQ